MADDNSTTPPTEQEMLDFITEHAHVDSETARAAYSGDEKGLNSLFNLVSAAKKQLNNAGRWLFGSLAFAIAAAPGDGKILTSLGIAVAACSFLEIREQASALDGARDTALTRFAVRGGTPPAPQG